MELQTLEEFATNPMGKGTSILPNRDVILSDFKRRKKIIEDHGKKFEVSIYTGPKGIYYFHVLVPSEDEGFRTDIKYDVVFELIPPKLKIKPKLTQYKVKVFSNSPSFTFTYAYIAYKEKIGVENLKDKFSKQVLTKAPKVRNPMGVMLYEKTLTFAALELLDNDKYFSEEWINSNKKDKQEKVLFRKIKTADEILELCNKSKGKKEKKENSEDELKYKEKNDKHEEAIKSNNPKSIKKIEAKKSTSKENSSVKKVAKKGTKKTTRRK